MCAAATRIRASSTPRQDGIAACQYTICPRACRASSRNWARARAPEERAPSSTRFPRCSHRHTARRSARTPATSRARRRAPLRSSRSARAVQRALRPLRSAPCRSQRAHLPRSLVASASCLRSRRRSCQTARAARPQERGAGRRSARHVGATRAWGSQAVEAKWTRTEQPLLAPQSAASGCSCAWCWTAMRGWLRLNIARWC
mmetsp:Transcript_42978/g.100712  ORF Transcript_42978/g.100712 Transcript_42978/m.100712 type:complete len:202 (-) Transcript_42978:230-835(-)